MVKKIGVSSRKKAKAPTLQQLYEQVDDAVKQGVQGKGSPPQGRKG